MFFYQIQFKCQLTDESQFYTFKCVCTVDYKCQSDSTGSLAMQQEFDVETHFDSCATRLRLKRPFVMNN